MKRPRPHLIREEVPESTMAMARERTQTHLNHMAMVGYDLRQLAANCWMQGATDMAHALIAKGVVPSDEDVVLNYEI